MAVPNAIDAGNNAKVDSFFAVFSSGNDADTKVTSLLALFSDDDANPPTIPCVGITSYGPNFTGRTDIKLLFHRLFSTFDPLFFTPTTSDPDGAAGVIVVAPRLYSADGFAPPTISVQTSLVGTHVDWWFPKTNKSHYSPPLSDVKPSGKRVTVPAAAVFNFDGTNNNKITHLWMYLDRYRFFDKLQGTFAALNVVANSAVPELLTHLSRRDQYATSERSSKGRQ
jgi:hypothetical protein